MLRTFRTPSFLAVLAFILVSLLIPERSNAMQTATAAANAVTFTLPSFVITSVLPLILPFISSGVTTFIHAEFVKASSWYASVNTTIQTAIAVVVGILFVVFGTLIHGVPGGDAVVSTCSASGTGPLSPACLSAIGGLINTQTIAAALTAILTAAGVLSAKAGAIHSTLKDIASQQKVNLSRASH